MSSTFAIRIGPVEIGGGAPLALIAGPCVIESRGGCLSLAKRLAKLAEEEKIPLIFKASYDKANRSSAASFRGPGLEKGLEILAEVKETTGLPVLTDVHDPLQAERAADVVDVLQVPAFLCRQTDLLLACGRTGRVVNVKKGQFLAPEDMANVVAKLEGTGNRQIMLTERGTTFGYHNLVVDMRALPVMRAFGYPVVFDATHSVQKPGGGGTYTSGDASMAPVLARAAVAAGVDAIFLETHVNPQKALSDKDNAIPFSRIRELWRVLRRVHDAVAGS
ncbi:MAG: 3-deoxy-8-phosphooctulonate synthase [Kiritimatiellae bacterium]|nr:3-deoxy-8-phosphooctulonate synthase [Kiritimatiellia bacterium]MDW8457814.1 3-deoxy-8-phosphooctulonate synthase [Verrucomicrobiota bacterium]